MAALSHAPFSIPPATPISLRILGERDSVALAKMYGDFDPQDRTLGVPPAGPEQVRTWLEGLRRSVNLGAFVSDRLVAHAVVVPAGASAELALFVHPDFRGRGIATALGYAALAQARASNAQSLWVLIDANNTAARAGLMKAGFHTRWEGMGALEMSHPL